MVYAKTGLSIFKIDTVSDFQQYCCFKVSDVTFFLVYRSPNAPPASIDCLGQLIRAAPTNSLIIGDINLPEVDWEVAAGTGKAGPLLEAMQDRLMTQLIDFPTQVSGNILDLLITDMPERIQDIKPDGRLGGSDHVVINCTVTMDIPRTRVKKSVLMWNKADFTGMGAQLGSTPWEDLFRTRSANEQWEVFRDHLQAAVNKYVPVKQAGPPGRPPWMSREISAAIRSKRRLWRETQSRGRTEEYRRADKEVKKLIRKSKREYEKKLAKGGPTNRRPFYAYVKRKTKSRQTVGPLLDRAKNKVTDNKGMVDLLNRYFSSVFTPDAGGPVPDAAPTVAPYIGDLRVTTAMVEKAIEKLRPSSAAGPDGIGPQLLQQLKATVAPVLASIFNTSLKDGCVPEDWRKAHVNPIFKKGAKSEPGNYRPVLLTSVCGKLLERLIKDRVMEHLLKNNLIFSSQHGFMPNKSCTTNLLEFFETVSEAIDGGDPFDVLFLDFAKAFDKVPTRPLLAKLEALGVGGQLLTWIREWLTD